MDLTVTGDDHRHFGGASPLSNLNRLRDNFAQAYGFYAGQGRKFAFLFNSETRSDLFLNAAKEWNSDTHLIALPIVFARLPIKFFCDPPLLNPLTFRCACRTQEAAPPPRLRSTLRAYGNNPVSFLLLRRPERGVAGRS